MKTMKNTLLLLLLVLNISIVHASYDNPEHASLNPHINDCGDRSLRECQDRTALIVIDMQPYFAERNGAYKDKENAKKLEEIIEQQKKAIEMAKANGMPIVMIEYECSVCDPTSSELMETLGSYEDSSVIKKTSDGMFDSWNTHRAELKEHLDSLGVDNLIITGANGGACVESSIDGALRENYDVLAINNGIADFNFSEFMYPYTYEENHWRFSRSIEECDGCSLTQYETVDDVRLALSLNEWTASADRSARENDENRGTPVEDKGRIRRFFERVFDRSSSTEAN